MLEFYILLLYKLVLCFAHICRPYVVNFEITDYKHKLDSAQHWAQWHDHLNAFDDGDDDNDNVMLFWFKLSCRWSSTFLLYELFLIL